MSYHADIVAPAEPTSGLTVNLGNKRDKKNAKDGGGIAAAVTRQAAGKFASATNADDNSAPAAIQPASKIGINASGNSSQSRLESDASSPPASNTPDTRPFPVPNNANHATSPLLDALSSASVSASTAPSMANEWARGGFAGSPGNLISLMGESPPTQPSSYEESARLHQHWGSPRPFGSASPASPSPPRVGRRPLSVQMDPHYRTFDTPSPAGLPAAYRRSSMHSQVSHARNGSNHPLPHQAQAHFYGAPDLDLTLKPNAGMRAGDKGYFFGLDRLPTASNPVPTSENVVVSGYEGGLEVHAITKRGLESVASLKGLRGGVHQAKILPWTAQGPRASEFPLIAVVLHGPVLPLSVPEVAIQAEGNMSPSGAASPHSVYTADAYRNGPLVDSYQTSVQVYSLKTSKLVDVLLQAPKVPINMAISFTSPVFQPPPLSGAFQIKADAGNIVVASGVTGECWIYQQLLEPQNTHMFACAGKVWTSMQQIFRGEVVEEGDKTQTSTTAAPRQNPQNPIFSLNQNWIAYCPATPSSSLTMRAHTPVPTLGRAPGVSTAAPPHLPNVTTTVDLPISDGVMNKIMRETTQELIQGAKWVGKQGLQAWNTYWNKNATQTPQQQARSPPPAWRASDFPPTHGATGKTAPKDPGLISIIDTETLASSASPHPIATFAAPLGCGFLSFSPSSLALFTASSKGDVQTVWDLMRLQHTRSSPLQSTLGGDSVGPQVRQVAQFSRMTVARVVNVIWSEPQGEHLAMVTERGTVHLMDIPVGAFIWPPPRRRKAAPEPTTESPEAAPSAVSLASGAFGAAYQAAKPFVTRPRRSSANVPPTSTGSTFKDSAAHGGRVIAASVSQSLSKTGTAINQLRHTGENRVALPATSGLPSAACVAWVKGRKSTTLYAVGGGVVRAYPSKRSKATTPGGKRAAKIGRYRDCTLPLLPDDGIPPVVRQIVETGVQEEFLDLSEREMEAGNTVTLAGRPTAPAPADVTLDASIPQAEIEASAPYQPFRTDRRVTLCEYISPAPALGDSVGNLVAEISLDEKPASKKKKGRQVTSSVPESSTSVSSAVWAFGQAIPVTRLDPGLPLALSDGLLAGPDDHRALPPSAMERVMQYGDEEQIVVTTRRRRGAREGDPDEDGFFEDDCEVLDFADQRV